MTGRDGTIGWMWVPCPKYGLRGVSWDDSDTRAVPRRAGWSHALAQTTRHVLPLLPPGSAPSRHSWPPALPEEGQTTRCHDVTSGGANLESRQPYIIDPASEIAGARPKSRPPGDEGKVKALVSQHEQEHLDAWSHTTSPTQGRRSLLSRKHRWEAGRRTGRCTATNERQDPGVGAGGDERLLHGVIPKEARVRLLPQLAR